MGKLTKLLIAGLGAYTVKYYLDNPKKAEEHKEILKEKIDNSISYTKCMWNYTQENGVAASAEYLKNDIEKVVKNSADVISEKVEDTVNYGKQLVSDSSSIKSNALDIKDKGIELTSNLTEATKILKEEVAPALSSYIADVKDIVNNITTKAEEIKETISEDKVADKVTDFKEKTEKTIEQTKETFEELTNKEFSTEDKFEDELETTVPENSKEENIETKSK